MLWEFLRDAYDDFVKLVTLNLLWVVTTLPVITAPAAAAGLYYAANRMAHHTYVDWRTFFEGFRRFWWLGWRWALLNLLVLGLMVFNYLFYDQFATSWASWMQGLFFGMAVLWLLLQMYTFPLLLEQADRRLIVALRNSLVLYLKRPGLGLGLALLLLALAILSTVLWVPWLLFTASLSVYLATRVTVTVASENRPAGDPDLPLE